MRKTFCFLWPLAMIIFGLIMLTGCSCPRQCHGPACCMPPTYIGPPCPVITCPQRKYSEEQWQYFDRDGAPRQMGDSALRDHLGLSKTPPAEPTP